MPVESRLLMEDELVIKMYWAVSKAAVAVAEFFGLEPHLEIEELMLKLCISYHIQTLEFTADLSTLLGRLWKTVFKALND